jgi:hypothetical protein
MAPRPELWPLDIGPQTSRAGSLLGAAINSPASSVPDARRRQTEASLQTPASPVRAGAPSQAHRAVLCQLEVAIVSTAVVTGPSERVADMAVVLQVAGFEVLVPPPDEGQIPSGSEPVDCYVQLPAEVCPTGEDRPGRPHVQTLAARFDAAAQVAPMLASGATVVLVSDPPDVTPAPDMRLVRLLVEAIIADHGGDAVRIAVVDGARPDDEIAALAHTLWRSI